MIACYCSSSAAAAPTAKYNPPELIQCPSQVGETLSDEARESQSVGQLKQQLTALQAEVDAASQRLAVTKARMAHNMQRVDQLKSEAVSVGCLTLCLDGCRGVASA